MSRLLNALAYVAPQLALKRAQALAALDLMRGYDAAQNGRRTASFRKGAGSANAEISRALPALRERSRELVRNSYIGQRALDVLTSHIVGTDMTVRFATGNKRADAQAQALWNDWIHQCDTTGEGNFNSVISLALRAALEGGDSIIRMVDRKLTPDLAVPLQLLAGEGDLIDETRDQASIGAGAQNARLGIALGDFDARAGYWLFDKQPAEQTIVNAQRASTLVAREYVCHLYRPLRPGQVRGVPLFAPVLLAARDYADLVDALVVKERMQACISVIIQNAEPMRTIGQKVSGEANEEFRTLRPGLVPRLGPGETAVPFVPGSNSSFDPVSRATLMGIAAGVGITYDQLTGDLTQANYSSLRAGKIEFRRLIADWQWNVLVPQVLRRIVARWVSRAILANKLQARAGGYPVNFVMPAHEPIDPKKDLEADILAVRSGRMSPQDFVEAWGRDWREVMAEWKEFIEAADNAGLIFDIDARQRTRVGQEIAGDAPAGATNN